ncbi:MAG: UDP-N-acetylmuramate--L-alanine ligase [Eubacteriales bacterium]|nr:UDP-N-acetylmuramate--L-alanine ligase [Eubacteriales bacterium]
MFKINFDNPIHVHFIGIGGISMSGLAKILCEKNFIVSGSDSARSSLTDDLTACGCSISYPQSADNINNGIDLVVYTAAIHPDNPELIAAKNSNIPTITRAELLGQIMANYKTAINVAGTHGKTTTTSMISEILLAGQCDPTISVGGILDSIGGNIRVGKSDIFLTEACEYTNSFLSFLPTLNIILNVKEDHLDFFKDIDDIRHSFKFFVEKLPKNGTLIINTDIDDYSYFYKDTDCEVITVGSNPEISKYSAIDITYDETGCCTYTLLIDGSPSGSVTLSVPGIHNVYNSLAAAAAGFRLGLSFDIISRALSGFSGTERRFEKKGIVNGFTIIDDYAHHPDEIRATLSCAKHYPHKTTWCVFQPHTYSRTKLLLDDFAKALSMADKVVLAKIYASRETDTLGISSANLRDKIQALGKECYYFESFEEIEKFLLKNCINGDLLITMGAGDIYKVGEDLLK